MPLETKTMTSIMAVELDLPVLVADTLVDSGVLDHVVSAIAKVLGALPARIVAWFGPELRTPQTTPAPMVSFAEPGPWNGAVFVEADTPTYWLLVKANAAKGARFHQSPPPFADPYGRPDRGWPAEPNVGWEDSYPYERPPGERDPWKR
jgi:hypothetical protein